MNAIEDYENKVNQLVSTVNASGRYSFRQDAMKLIPMDIVSKLELEPTDTLLDVGCNLGDITIPLSFVCKNVTGIDGEGVIEKIQDRVSTISNINFIAGDFLELDISEKYDCVLSYSVLHYMESFEEQMEFVLKIASCLRSGGRALIGDIPNVSKKDRFRKSSEGQGVDAVYQENLKHLSEEDVLLQNTEFSGGKSLADNEIMELLLKIREAGYESFLLPQKHNFPFGCTREDIIIYNWN